MFKVILRLAVGMAQCKSTSTCVELLHGDVQSLLAGECLCSKGFVDFDLKIRAMNSGKILFCSHLVNLSQANTSLLQHCLGLERFCDFHDMKVR